MNLPLRLALLDEGEQPPLPGLEDAAVQLPLAAPVRETLPDWPLGPHPPSPAQLQFGPNQMVFSEVEPDPQQLSLLPDPPPWELPDHPRPAGSTRRRSRHRPPRISPGQRSLF